MEWQNLLKKIIINRLEGQNTLISMSTQVKETFQTAETTKGDEKIEVIIDREVYDLTQFVNQHPGGVAILRKYMNRQDATNAFHEALHSERALNMMTKFKTGETIEEEQKDNGSSTEPKATQTAEPNEITSLVGFGLKIS